jgi:hypothetical protein
MKRAERITIAKRMERDKEKEVER